MICCKTSSNQQNWDLNPRMGEAEVYNLESQGFVLFHLCACSRKSAGCTSVEKVSELCSPDGAVTPISLWPVPQAFLKWTRF